MKYYLAGFRCSLLRSLKRRKKNLGVYLSLKVYIIENILWEAIYKRLIVTVELPFSNICFAEFVLGGVFGFSSKDYNSCVDFGLQLSFLELVLETQLPCSSPQVPQFSACRSSRSSFSRDKLTDIFFSIWHAPHHRTSIIFLKISNSHLDLILTKKHRRILNVNVQGYRISPPRSVIPSFDFTMKHPTANLTVFET